MIKKIRALLPLFLIIILAGIFRFTGVNWDNNAHLHPDERFLTMVINAMRVPSSFFEYMNPAVSTMNPANIGYKFFVYGLAPLTLNKLLAIVLGNDSYVMVTLQGRVLSGFFDIIALVFLFKIVEVLEKEYKLSGALKYWTALGYAFAVLPIQLSHFYAVDTFLNTFSIMSVYFILRALFIHKLKKEKHKVYIFTALSAVSWGLALSSKITAVYMLPLIAGLVIATFHKKYNWKVMGAAALIWLAAAYFTVRLVSPYMFDTSDILNPKISSLYLQNLKELKSFDDPKSYFPPSIQWSHIKPLVYSFGNMFWFSYGPVGTLLTMAGMIFVFRKKHYVLWVFSVWTLLFFLYQSTQVTQPVRYFNHQFPYYALFAGIAILAFTEWWKEMSYIFFPVLLIWPLAFLSIYVKPHSRIAASEWIYRTIPAGKIIAVEHWDDALPVSLDGNHIAQSYTFAELPVFAPDTDPTKWTEINSKLTGADYYILSSNRAWRSIQNAPDKYPVMSNYYETLFAGKNPRLKKFAHFASFPSLRYLGIPLDFPDTAADETFTVYDHPEVYIFRNTH